MLDNHIKNAIDPPIDRGAGSLSVRSSYNATGSEKLFSKD